jgi:hypothetical protein
MGESGFHIWESDDGEFEAVFYHESNDLQRVINRWA